MTHNSENLSDTKKSSTLCSIPWNHLVIQQNGKYRACCQCIRYPYGFLIDEKDQEMNILTHTIDQARNSKVLKDLRSRMMKGEKPSVCSLCWEEESLGITSRRMHVQEMFGDPNLDKTLEDGTIDVQEYPLEYMDLRFGNLCNQACRSCGPTDSSLWYDELSKRQSSFNFYGIKTYNFKNKGASVTIDSEDFLWYNQPNFEVEFRKNLKFIKRLYFTGGEPTINKAHFNTLQICIDEGVSKNIALDYNSNLMSIPDHLLEKWSHFATIHIGASIDAYGDLATYVRYPSIWSNIEKNISFLDNYPYKNRISLKISSTISILNVLNFLDLTEWLINSNFQKFRKVPSYHMLNGPNYLNVQILPDKTKDMIREKYEIFFEKLKKSNGEYDSLIDYYNNIITFMYAKKGNIKDLTDFFYQMSQSDKFRKQNLFQYVPWTEKIWKELNE